VVGSLAAIAGFIVVLAARCQQAEESAAYGKPFHIGFIFSEITHNTHVKRRYLPTGNDHFPKGNATR
jgi:hypothetical protein